MKAMTGSNGWLEREWFEGTAHESGMPVRGEVTRVEHRAPIVVRKHRNGCGAKGGREADT